VNPRSFAGHDLVHDLVKRQRSDGSYEGWPGSTAFAVMALRAAGAEGIEQSIEWLVKVQNGDGGWGDVPGSPSTADGTGAVMQALSPDSKAAQHGLSYLRRHQRQGGGFALGGNGAVNTQSTAWAIQGIVAAGGDPDSFRRGGASAPDYLSSQQRPDGHYRYSASSNQTPVWVTSQVLVAAASKSLPIPPPPREPTPAKKKAKTGGVSSTSESSPSISPTTTPPVAPEVAPASPASPESGGPGVPPNVLRPPGQIAPGAPAAGLPPAGRERGGTGTPATEASASDESADDSKGAAGAIALGLLAGGLAFAAALGGRRAWMRWRYGL